MPAYAVLAMAMGKVNLLLTPVPAWNPATWNPGYVSKAFSGALPGGEYWPAVRNTLVYVGASLALCFAIGYPVAYYVARHARRTKTLLIVLLVIPFWVSYLLRMLAWIGLLSTDGYVNKVLTDDRDRASAQLAQRQRLLGDPRARLRLHPVLHPARVRRAGPDRPQPDRGGARPRRHPVSGVHAGDAAAEPAGVLAGSALVVLPMFGDYYTNDLISASPRTNMLGNEINLFIQGGPAEEPRGLAGDRADGDLVVGMLYYVFQTARDARRLA